MKHHRLLWLSALAPLTFVPLFSGCSYIEAPPVDPIPTAVPTPKAPYFNPADGQPEGLALNANPLIQGSPAAFRSAGAVTGDTVAIQSVTGPSVTAAASDAATSDAATSDVATGTTSSTSTSTTTVSADGSVATTTTTIKSPSSGASATASKPAKTAAVKTPTVSLGTPDTVRLAGVIAPSSDPGLQDAKKAINEWLSGQDLDVSRDKQFPYAPDGKQLVQIFFKSRPGTPERPNPYEGAKMSLNRMLIRSGLAVVDMYSPTSFDTTQWLLDEQHAKRLKVGIWRTGQVIQQRVAPKLPMSNPKDSKINVQASGVRPSKAPVVSRMAAPKTTGTPVPGGQTSSLGGASTVPSTIPSAAPATSG